MVAALIVITVCCTSFGEETPDTLRFDHVAAFFPGQPETGVMRAGLQWSTGSGILFELDLHISWTGNITCDSLVANPAMESLFTIWSTVNNEESDILISHSWRGDQQLDYPAQYDYGDLYFSLLDTGVVQFTAGYPTFWPPTGTPVYVGRWVESSYFISNPGDVNRDGIDGNVSDVVYLIGYIFGTEPAEPTPFADINGDCMTNITDAVVLISYIFGKGSEPTSGCVF